MVDPAAVCWCGVCLAAAGSGVVERGTGWWRAVSSDRGGIASKTDLFVRLFLALEIVQRRGGDHPSLGRTNHPFAAVGIVAGFANGVVSHDVDDEILGAVVEKLVRFVGFEEEGVARSDGSEAGGVTRLAAAGEHVVELELGAVGVEGAGRFPGRDAADLDVEGMTFGEIGGEWLAAQGDRDLLIDRGKLALRRAPRFGDDVAGVHFVHGTSQLCGTVRLSSGARAAQRARAPARWARPRTSATSENTGVCHGNTPGCLTITTACGINAIPRKV